MRLVIQRVAEASVSVGGAVIASIGPGLLVFLGVEKGDREADADMLLEKAIHLRIFEDTQGKMNLSLIDVAGAMLVISQFTLVADCRKGRRPSFTDAEDPAAARELYRYFVGRAAEKVARVADGEFQAMMQVALVNDGPVTMLLDSRKQR